MRKFVTLLLLVLGAACAGGPSYGDIEDQIPPVPVGKGRIYYFRSGSMFGAAIHPSIYLNDAKVGDSVPGGFFFTDRPPGDYEVKCATETDRRLTFTLAARETVYVQTVLRMGLFVGHADPVLVDPKEGRDMLRKSNYTGTEWTPATKEG